MKSRPLKIKAFTVNEMIVVLLITVIVVGMAFSVLNLVQRQMNGIGGIYDVKLETNALRQSLWADFNRYSYIVYNGQEERLYLSNELDAKYYEITENGIINQKDTFNIRLQSIAFYFNNGETTAGEVDAIELKTSKETGNQQIFVYKQNAAATYVNQ